MRSIFLRIKALLAVSCLCLLGVQLSFTRESPSGPQPAPSARRAEQGESAELSSRLDTLVKKLGDDDFDTREAATSELASYGCFAYPALVRGSYVHDFEVRYRIELLLKPFVKEQERQAAVAVREGLRCRLLRQSYYQGVALDSYFEVSTERGALDAVTSPLDLLEVVNDDGSKGAEFPWQRSNISASEGTLKQVCITVRIPDEKISSIQLKTKMQIRFCYDPERFEVTRGGPRDLKLRDGVLTIDSWGTDHGSQSVSFRVHHTLCRLYQPQFRAWDSKGAERGASIDWREQGAGYSGTLTATDVPADAKLDKFAVTYYRRLGELTCTPVVTIPVPRR